MHIYLVWCARWNWETNLKSLNDFSVERGEVITLQNSSYPRQSINIHHPVTTHSSQNGKKKSWGREGLRNTSDWISGRRHKSYTLQAKSFVLGKLVWAGAIILAWTLWLWERNSSFQKWRRANHCEVIQSPPSDSSKITFFALHATTGPRVAFRTMIVTFKKRSRAGSEHPVTATLWTLWLRNFGLKLHLPLWWITYCSTCKDIA